MRKLPNFALLLPLGYLALGACHAQDTKPKPNKYPLRLHLLAIDDTHQPLRMQPNWCSTFVPDLSGGSDRDPCANSGSLGFGGDDDFAGSGRADLVSPPNGTQALSFSYEGCSRVRVPSGFQSLRARWKKPGKKLEVLIPTDAVTGNNRPIPTEKCTFTATLYDFVYLRLGNGAILKVSQDAYWSRPALRSFLSGGRQTLEQRPSPVISVKDLEKP